MTDPCLEQNLKGHKKPVTGLKYHKNQHQLVSCSEDNSLMIWNLSTKDVRCYKFSGHTDAVTDIDWGPKGRLIASSSCDKTVRLWVPSVRGGSAVIKAHTSAVRSVQFSENNQQLITGSNDKSVKLWDVPRRKFLLSFPGHTNWVYCTRFIPLGNMIVTCADDKTIRVWDTLSRQCVHNLATPKGSATKIAPHENGYSFAAATVNGSVRIYDIRSRKLLQHYILHDRVTDVTWHPEGRHLMTTGADGTMRIVDVMEGRPLYTLNGCSGGVSAIAFSKDGEQFASAGADKSIMIWKTNFVESYERISTTTSLQQSSIRSAA